MNKELIIDECPYCDSKNTVEPIEEIVEQEYRGEIIKYKQKGYYCAKCKEKFQSGGQLDDNLLAIKEAYLKKSEDFNIWRKCICNK